MGDWTLVSHYPGEHHNHVTTKIIPPAVMFMRAALSGLLRNNGYISIQIAHIPLKSDIDWLDFKGGCKLILFKYYGFNFRSRKI